MAELNHFRKYAIAQSEEGDPLEILRDDVRVVCLGFDTSRHRFVEIGALTSGDHDCFIRRARIASSLRHPAVASVVDCGKEDGSCFYVCDFVDGEVISDYAARVKAIDPGAVVTWLVQLAEGCAVLEAAGLHPGVSSARLRMTGSCSASLRIVDHGIIESERKLHIGEELAVLLEALTNYQDSGESPVYPPEVGELTATLRGISSAGEVVAALQAAGLECDEPGFSPGQRPRLILERQLFRKIRPEHVLPERYSALQRAGEVSPYECIAEDSSNGEMLRVLILPPERIIPERMLNIFEDAQCPSLINSVAFWKHEEFRLIAERVEPGFSLDEWLDAVPRCEVSEISVVLNSLEAMLAEVSETTFSPRLHPADIFFVFPDVEEDREYLLNEVQPVADWPQFYFMVRPHRTVRALTDITYGNVPGGADEVFEAAERGEWLPTKLIISWYLSLWRRGLVHQAEELVVTLRQTGGAHEPVDNDGSGSRQVFVEEEQVVLSPIAEAMGIIGDDGGDCEMASNPIARQVWLGDDPDSPSIDDEYDDEREEILANPAEKTMKIVFCIIAAIFVAISIAHCSGKAFWL